MSTQSTAISDRLAPHRSTAFTAAGLVMLAFTALLIVADVAMTIPETGLVALFVVGIGLGVLGAIGLYPAIADHAEVLARLGAFTGVVGVVALATILLWWVGAAIGLGIPASPPEILWIVLMVALVLAFGSVGIAAVRTGRPSSRVGYLLLGLGLPWIILIAGSSVYGGGETPLWLDTIVFGLFAGLLFAIAYRLRDEPVVHDEADMADVAV